MRWRSDLITRGGRRNQGDSARHERLERVQRRFSSKGMSCRINNARCSVWKLLVRWWVS
jgi:hypothetical protein